MAERSPFESMYQKFQSAIYRLRTALQFPSYQWVSVSTALSRALLFPLLLWGTLWLLVRVFPSSAVWNLTLIATFCLPLVSLFVAYRVIAAIVLLGLGQDVYATLIARFLRPLFVTYVVVQFMGLFDDISLIGDIQLFTVVKTTITLRALFISSIGLYLWFAGVSSLAQVLRTLLLKRLHIDEGTIDASLILLRYFLIALGLSFAFAELKLDSTAIAAISGGLAVGIGFGLKDIVVNFLSGIMLLFERTLRPGDIIEVNSQMGRVEEINLRATTIRTNDHVDLVIPNQIFWTSSLTSYTRRSRMARFMIKVLVGYDYSPDTVTAILLNAVRENSKLATSLTAKVEIGSFDQAGVLYQLKFWTDDPLGVAVLRDKIYRHLWNAFAAEGIELDIPTNVAMHSLESPTRPSLPLDRSPAMPAPSSGLSQIELIESSFEKIKPKAAEFSASFYQNLFRDNPKLRPMFKETDMKKQQQKIVATLTLMVANIRNPDQLALTLRDLGARHKGYGVVEKHYPAVNAALLQAFDQHLKADWTQATKQAWADTFEAVAQMMIEGEEEAL